MIEIVPVPPSRAQELYDLGSKVFSHNGYFEFLRYCRQTYFGAATYDWPASRIAVQDGRIISHVGVWDYQMRVGRARLRTGGIGLVLTHPEHRKKGLAAQVMTAVMASMRQGGYDYSVLFGIRNYYHRFGFTQAWPDTRVHVALEALPEEPLRPALRKVSLTRALANPGPVMNIYNRESARRTGSAQRPIYRRTCKFWSKIECRTLMEGGKITGYVVTKKNGENLEVFEVGGLQRGCGAGAIWAALRRIARQQQCLRVVLVNLSYDHPLVRLARAGDCRVEMSHARSGAAMAAVVNLRSCLEKMAPELTERLRRSPLRDFDGALVVAGQGESVRLAIHGGSVQLAEGGRGGNVIQAGPNAARLIIGSESPAVLAEQGMVRFKNRAANLAEALFPAQWPMLSTLDHF